MKFKINEDLNLEEGLKRDILQLKTDLAANGFTILSNPTNSSDNDNYVLAYSSKLNKTLLIMINRISYHSRNNTTHYKNNVDSVNKNGLVYNQSVNPIGNPVGKSFIGNSKKERRFNYDKFSIYTLDAQNVDIDYIINNY